MGGRRRSKDENSDMSAELSNSRFTDGHRKIGKTVFAAISLFTVGSVRQ